MHPANACFWRELVATYPRDFSGKRVGEFGSYNINDPDNIPRSLTTSCDYVGIDWRDGPNVDHVSLVHEVDLPQFDTIVSASMLEHDPYWDKSIERMVELLRPGGLLALTWGAARNFPHCFQEAPDGKFHALRAGLVLRKLEQLSICVRLFCYETRWGGGEGEVVLVGFKPDLDTFMSEDEA